MKSFLSYNSAILATLITTVFSISIVQAQNGKGNPVSTATPTAPSTAALLKYIDFNMNSNTGVPDINIPLVDIKGKKLSLPLSISYNASGIKVNEQASNIGLCWSLNGVGLISRAIRGKFDDASFWSNIAPAFSNGFDPHITPEDLNIARLVNDKVVDGAPDLYSYAFGGYSGKFLNIIGKTKAITMLPKKPLIIEEYRTPQNQPPAIPYFKVITEDGTHYYFAAIETTSIRTSYAISTASYTWHLTSIISADGTDQISFVYEDTYYEELPALGESFTYMRKACDFGTAVKTGSKPDTYFTSSTRIAGKQLKTILFNEGSVDFDISYDRLDKFGDIATVKNPKINHIFLKNKQGEILKTISFNYSYYNETASDFYMKRLRLDQLDICPQPAQCGNPKFTQSYKFTYDATPLPALNSFAQDHWGYYNGVNTNVTLLPTYPINLTPVNCYTLNPYCGCSTINNNSFTGANRNSSTDYTKAGVLEKIEYPTGGNVQFNYEINQTTPLTYPKTLPKGYNKAIYNNPNNNGAENTASTPESDLIETNAYSKGGVCATATVNYYTNSIPKGTLKSFPPSAQVIKYDADGAGSLVTNIPLAYAGENKSVNFTMFPGYTYSVVFTTKVKETSIEGALNYKVPIATTVPYYVGGLRLKQKTVVDPVSTTSAITTYAYSDGTYKQPIYEQYSLGFPGPNGTCGEVCLGTGGNGKPPHYYDKQESTTLVANYGGIDNEINYSQVTTIYGASGENGKTITNFLPYNNDYFWRKGSIDNQQDFNASGKLLKKVVNQYVTSNSEIIQGLEVSGVYEHPCLELQPQNFDIYSKYVSYKPTFNPSEWYYLSSTSNTTYDQNGKNPYTVKTDYTYGNPAHMQLTGTATTDSKQTQLATMLRYPPDYDFAGTLSGTAKAIKTMVDKNIINAPIEELKYSVKSTDYHLLNAKLHTYKLHNDTAVVNDKNYFLKQHVAEGKNNIQYFTHSSIDNGQFTHDKRYEQEETFTQHDANNNFVELAARDNNHALIRSANGDTWANTLHADYKDIAYSSFEHDDINKDFTNWVYENKDIVTRSAFNGTRVFGLKGAEQVYNMRKLNNNQTYKISFWMLDGTVEINTHQGEKMTASTRVVVPLRKGPVRQNWTYYEGIFTDADYVSLGGTAIIDELRLYPNNARMHTYVHKMEQGIISECNENNQKTDYLFDDFNRLKLMRDQDGNILKKNEYEYQQVQQ